ncbi:MAG: US12 family protein [Parcubacteria group bacterium]|nr:US12 family protein [Parcubacteria group bacterium]
MFSSDVYERRGVDTMTRNAFYFVMGCVLAWGFTATYITSQMTAHWRPGLAEVLLVGFVLPFLGILLSTSHSALLSFFGFNLVVIPLSAILGPGLAHYDLVKPGLVSQAAVLTGTVTVVMAISGLLFPNFYRSIGGALFGALVALLVVLVISMFVPALMGFTIIHYCAAGLFALYVGYDMYRASEIPATLDNAVDVCISLYLDIINLFLWILRILGNNND